MTDIMTGCAKTPLSDLLRRIPQEAVYNWTVPEEGRELWHLGSESAPIGRLAHEAADALDAMLAASPQGEGGPPTRGGVVGDLDLYDDKVQAGISWTMRQWGEALGLTTWTQGDGSESVEGDVGAEIHTILIDAGLRDPETNEMVRVKALELEAMLAASPQGEGSSTGPAPIKPSGDTGELRERVALEIRNWPFDISRIEGCLELAAAILDLIQSERAG